MFRQIKKKNSHFDFWDGLSIFSIGLFELSALYFVWHLAFTLHDDPIIAIIAATFTVVIVLIDCTAILNNKLNNMEYEAKHFMPDVKYKLDRTHSNVEEARSLLNRIDNRSVEMQVYIEKIHSLSCENQFASTLLAENKQLSEQCQRDVIKILELNAEISQLNSQVAELKIKLLDCKRKS